MLVLAILLNAGVLLVNFWMVFQLLPSVAIIAVKAIDTGILVFDDFVCRVPRLTLLGAIRKQVGLATIILPVVSVNTQFPLVVLLLIGTPGRLKMEHVEVRVPIESLHQVN